MFAKQLSHSHIHIPFSNRPVENEVVKNVLGSKLILHMLRSMRVNLNNDNQQNGKYERDMPRS